MSHVRIAVVLGLLSCTRNQGTAEPPTASSATPRSVAEDEKAGPVEQTGRDPELETGPQPTPDELFQSWAREEPAEAAKSAAFDKPNVDRMLGYWGDLACFRGRVLVEGRLVFGSEPGSKADDRFFEFRNAFIRGLDDWLKNFFAKEPRIWEQSRFVNRFLEAHGVVMTEYPKAFRSGEAAEVKRTEAHWVTVEARTKAYVESLGGTWKAPVCDATPEPKKNPS